MDFEVRKYAIWCLFAAMTFCAAHSSIAQNSNCTRNYSAGDDFWVTFLCNDDDPANSELSVIATGPYQAAVTVTNPVTGWTQTSTLTAGDKVKIQLPTASTIPSGQPHNIGYHVTSTAPITLYSSNYKAGSLDFTQVLPYYAIGDNYIVQNYPNNSDHPANIAIVATEDETEISMVLPCTVTGVELPVGSTFSVTLAAGQSLMLRANQGYHFSGMEVVSNCKPFALFQGCGAGRVGDNTNSTGRDHFMEQALPPSMWGIEFVADASLDRTEGDRVLITAGADNCLVRINDVDAASLTRGQSYEYTLGANATAHIVTTQPAYACLYLASYRNGGTLGDPGAASLPPVSRWVCHSDFMLHQNNDNPSQEFYISNTYINIIAETSSVGLLALDGATIPASQFSPIAGTPYSHARMHIAYGAHTLDGGLFAARAYGLGRWSGFAYNIAMMTDTLELCPPGIRRDTVRHEDTVCQGTDYTGYGFVVSSQQSTNVGILNLMDSTMAGDTVVHYRLLTLHVLPNSSGEANVSVNVGDSVVFMGCVIYAAGDYRFTLTAANGCDSIVTLHVSQPPVVITSSATGGCPGDEFILTAAGISEFYWSASPDDAELHGLQNQSPVTVHPEVTTTYRIHDANGNVVASITVAIKRPPYIEIRPNRNHIDIDNPAITLYDDTYGTHSSTWCFFDGDTLFGRAVQRSFQLPLPDTVSVTLRSCNEYCCSDSIFHFPVENNAIWFPNVITPDKAQNNRFGAFTICKVADFELFLYNRWGLLVWHSTDILDTWDGTHCGKPVPQSTYVYKWYMTDIYGKKRYGVGMLMVLK